MGYSLQDDIRENIAKYFGKDQVKDADNLEKDLGANTVDLVELSNKLEGIYGIEDLEGEIVYGGVKTVGDIITLIMRKKDLLR
mgnify:CR=1 FL=1